MFFTIVFIVEAILKIIALGFKGYFSRKSNLFDFFLVSVSVISLFVLGGFAAHFLRLFRIARAFRLIRALKVRSLSPKRSFCSSSFAFSPFLLRPSRVLPASLLVPPLCRRARSPRAQGLRIIFSALVISLPTILNVAGVGFILLFMYAVLGVSFYGRVK